MRIALLSHVASPAAPTGAERSLALLAEGLGGRGHDVTVFAPGPWSLALRLEQAGVAVRIVPVRPVWLMWYGRRGALYTAAKWAVAAATSVAEAAPGPARGRAALTEALRDLRPDVVHVNCLPHIHGAAAAHAAGCPVVWHLREILSPGVRRRFYARRLRRDATRLVAVSEAVAAWVREEGLDAALDVVHNGVRVPERGGAVADAAQAAAARAALGLPPDGCLVGLFGQLAPHKGAGAFLEAAGRALVEEPALRFVLAGHGPAAELDRVRAAAGALGGRAVLLPPQPDADRLVAAADVVALATLTPDPLPRAVLEAMAGARPVVAFDSGGTREMLVDGATGVLCAPGDVAALAAAFVRLARDPAARAAMGEAGRARARALFSVERHVERMEAVLASAAAAAASSRRA